MGANDGQQYVRRLCTDDRRKRGSSVATGAASAKDSRAREKDVQSTK